MLLFNNNVTNSIPSLRAKTCMDPIRTIPLRERSSWSGSAELTMAGRRPTWKCARTGNTQGCRSVRMVMTSCTARPCIHPIWSLTQGSVGGHRRSDMWRGEHPWAWGCHNSAAPCRPSGGQGETTWPLPPRCRLLRMRPTQKQLHRGPLHAAARTQMLPWCTCDVFQNSSQQRQSAKPCAAACRDHLLWSPGCIRRECRAHDIFFEYGARQVVIMHGRSRLQQAVWWIFCRSTKTWMPGCDQRVLPQSAAKQRLPNILRCTAFRCCYVLVCNESCGAWQVFTTLSKMMQSGQH